MLGFTASAIDENYRAKRRKKRQYGRFEGTTRRDVTRPQNRACRIHHLGNPGDTQVDRGDPSRWRDVGCHHDLLYNATLSRAIGLCARPGGELSATPTLAQTRLKHQFAKYEEIGKTFRLPGEQIPGTSS